MLSICSSVWFRRHRAFTLRLLYESTNIFTHWVGCNNHPCLTSTTLNTLMPRLNGWRFPDNILKCFWGHEWGDLPIIFTCDEVTRENHWQIASRVTPKSLFMVTNVLIYFLHAIWYPEHTIPPKQLSIVDSAIVAKDSIFWFSIVTSPQLICDVTRM